MLTHLSFGPATVPSYPFLALIGMWAGMWLAAREAKRLGLNGDHIYNIGLYAFLAALIGGRLWYVLTHWDAYVSAPLQALALTANAIAVPEALIFALLTAIVYIKRHKLSLALVADAFAPGLLLALIIGGIGAFLGSQTLGTITAVPWAVTIFEQTRHPAHLYQVGATTLVLIIVWGVRKSAPWPGFTFLLTGVLYAATRLLLDPFFDLPITIGNGYRLVQVSALLTMTLILIIMARITYTAGDLETGD